MSQRVQHIRGTTSEIETVSPLVAELGYDTTKREPHIGDGATLGGVRLAKKNLADIVAPAQITVDKNDYTDPTFRHARMLVLDADAARNITGLVPQTTADTIDGREIEFYNGAAAFNITLKDQSLASTAANRFDLNGADAVLAPKTSITLRYRSSVSRWILIGSTIGAAVAPSGVVARTLAASSQGFSLINGTIVESHNAGAVTFAIKTLTGGDPSVSDPVLVLLRNGALATGDYVMMTVTTAVSLTISSGSSLGVGNSVPFRVWLVGINDAGTFRLGAVNCGIGIAFSLSLSSDVLVSSTTEGGAGAADSAATIYTGTGAASKPFAPIAYADYPAGLAAAGTWNVSPTTLQLYHTGILLPGGGIATAARIASSAMGQSMINGQIVVTNPANGLQVTIKTLAGNDPSPADPVLVPIRNANSALGDFSMMVLTSAPQVLFFTAGATLGTASNTPFRIWLVGFNDAGTFRLAEVNNVNGVNVSSLPASGIASAANGNFNSAQAFFSMTTITAKPYAVLGYYEWGNGLATAGQWTSTPTTIQLFGPGIPTPGTPIGSARLDVSGVSTGTTIVPIDDTIPQNTEGDQYLSIAYSPNSSCNLIDVKAQLLLAHSQPSVFFAASIYQDALPNALKTGVQFAPFATGTAEVQINHTQRAATTSSITFKVRAGSNAAGTTTFNGLSGGRLYGGTMNSLIDVTERMA